MFNEVFCKDSKYCLKGRIVTMDDSHTIIDHGLVCIDAGTGRIAAVTQAENCVPNEFKTAPIIDTHGTIYPGLIELHNHLCYNILRQWQVPQRYDNRAQWRKCEEYHKLVSAPMKVISKTKGLPPAVVRYVECKCLMSGVTTSQGLSLERHTETAPYWGQLRNAEKSCDKNMPSAAARIEDVTTSDLSDFIKELEEHKCVLLHLSEGVDVESREHFCNLTNPVTNTCAVTPSLAGIHCTALTEEDYDFMGDKQASMIWSPLSNLILYGNTARIADAKKNGLLIGIGPDWSPSGSKNLLWELKVARLYSSHSGDGEKSLFTDRELVDMATRNGAKVLKWDNALGSIEVNKLADILVLCGTDKDPYAKILEASEKDVQLVTVGGIPRYGRKDTMKQLGGGTEPWMVARDEYLFNLPDTPGNPIDVTITLAEASKTLSQALANIDQLARDLEQPRAEAFHMGMQEESWTLFLDHGDPPMFTVQVPVKKRFHGTDSLVAELETREVPLSEIVEPMKLDPITVVDDREYLDAIKNQRNLPDYIKKGLQAQYQMVSG